MSEGPEILENQPFSFQVSSFSFPHIPTFNPARRSLRMALARCFRVKSHCQMRMILHPFLRYGAHG